MDISELPEKFEAHHKPMRTFLKKLEIAAHKGVKKAALVAENEVWQETNCVTCANCCKKMTPTFTKKDRQNIAAHLGLSSKNFKKQYLLFDKEDGDWKMQQQPCVFLDLNTNLCTIYPVRPVDCAGFPHLTKAPLKSFLYIHNQNIEYCPASFRFVEKMMERIEISKG